MRTQSWRAANAPDGPGAIIRCPDCGSEIFRLKPGESLTTGPVGNVRSETCKCGFKITLKVTNAG